VRWPEIAPPRRSFKPPPNSKKLMDSDSSHLPLLIFEIGFWQKQHIQSRSSSKFRKSFTYSLLMPKSKLKLTKQHKIHIVWTKRFKEHYLRFRSEINKHNGWLQPSLVPVQALVLLRWALLFGSFFFSESDSVCLLVLRICRLVNGVGNGSDEWIEIWAPVVVVLNRSESRK